MQCREFREMMDSYISDELLVETNHEVLKHLEDCADCRALLSTQRILRSRIRSAVKNSPEMQINSASAAQLKSNLRETTLIQNIWEKFKQDLFVHKQILALATVCLLIITAVGVIWFRNSSNENYTANNHQSKQPVEIPQPVESPMMQALQAAWREIAQLSIGDHKNCALKFRLAEKPVTLAEAAVKFGRYNKDLDKAVQAAIKEPAAKIHFFELKDKYTEEYLPNGGTRSVDHANGTTITLKVGNKTKSVYNFYGAPPELNSLQSKLDDLSRNLQR